MRKIFTKGIYIVSVFILFLGATLPARAQFTATTLESGNLASAVAKDASGNIYVVQFNLASGSLGGAGTGELVKYTNGTGAPTVIYTGIPDEGDAGNDWATGLVVASNGDIYLITDNNDPHTQDGQIIKLHFNGGTSYTASVWQTGTDSFGFYSALAIDSSDNIYAVLYNANGDNSANGIGSYEVVKYNANSAANSTPSAVLYQKLDENALLNEVNFDDGYAMTSGLAVAPNGDVYVTDAFNDDNSVSDAGRIWKLTKANGFAATIVSSNFNATGLAVDGSGNLFALQSTTTGVENGNYGLYEYPNGTATQSPTAIYTPLNAALTDLFPYGIAIVNNHDIFISDGQTNTGVNKVLQLQNSTTISSINRVSATPSNAASIQFTATFAASVTGVATSNFSLTTTGTASGTISSVSGAGTTYTVTVNSITGNGTIGLNMANATGLSLGISTTLPFAGQVYTMDNTAPTISIGVPSVSTIATGAGSVTYTVTYADANFNSSTLAAGNVSLNTTGNATGTIGISGTGTTRTVTISGITGSGSIGISIATGTASDLAGNTAPAAGPSTTFAVTLNTETITFAALPTKTYGNADFAPGATSDNGGVTITYSSDNNSVATIVSGNIHIKSAGTANITASQAADATHSAATDKVQALTVNTAPLTITADNQTSIRGQTLPTLTASYTGFVNNDNSASLTTLPTITTTGTPTSAPGPYPITASGAVDANYAISYVAGTLTITASSDATLASLTISSGTLSPVFGTGTNSYTATVGSGTASVTITPTSNDANATIKLNGTTVTSGTASGAIALNVGDNAITTVVTAQDGTTTDTYTVTVTRPSTNANLKLLLISSHTALTQTSGAADVNYATSVTNGTATVTVSPTAANAGATITVNGTPVTSGTASAPIALNAGSTTINLQVTAQDGIATKSYSITVNQAGSNDASLATLTLSSHTALAPTTGAANVNYATTVPGTTGSVTITPATFNAGATVTVNGNPVTSGTASGPIALTANSVTVINLLVTAQDGVTTTSYSVAVTRLPSADASLKLIVLNTHTALIPTAGAADVNYTTSVSNGTPSLIITSTTDDAAATVTVNGIPVTSGTASGAIALNVGATTINMLVTAQDGVTTQTYSIVVNQAGSSDAGLRLLLLSTHTALTQTTGPANINYTTSVGTGTASLTVTPTTDDPNATVTVNGTPVTSGTPSGAITLNVGPTTINLLVTGQDGITTQTYSVVVNQAGSNDARLRGLTVSTHTAMTQTSGPADINFSTTVNNGTASLTVTPTTDDPNATVTVNGTPVTSGTPSGLITLNAGPTIINVLATAQDGVTTESYAITVNQSTGFIPGYATYQPQSTNPAEVLQLATDDGIMVHQGVSPNGDGINDYLLIEGLGAYPDNKLMIINRNGQKVYETQGYDNNTKIFDGHSNSGAMQLPGTYFYSLEYRAGTEIKHKTGYIILKY